jgi:hypothetical protein
MRVEFKSLACEYFFARATSPKTARVGERLIDARNDTIPVGLGWRRH